ncbi:hypothetical protein, conserved [Leishmania tarentolae]|uniref:PAP/OAS1 substrate-binding-related domain-containing protein n=1 Tax=Leishmania tarentolae TaxID=5689 RepID=A0A640KK74_LEITA|nr:hypothetical protein, conserved [Leishmania tarentolae]
MEASGALDSSGDSSLVVASTAVTGCDAIMPALRKSVVAAAGSSRKPVSPSSSLGNVSVPDTHSPQSQDLGGGEKDRLWLLDSLHHAVEATATPAPGMARRPSTQQVRHRDSVMSLHSDNASSEAVPLTCISSPPSPLAKAECRRASEGESLDTESLNNAGDNRSSMPRLRSSGVQALGATSTTSPSKLRRSASPPLSGCNDSHILGTRLSTLSAAGGAGDGTGSRCSSNPLSERSDRKDSSRGSLGDPTAPTLMLQREPHARDTARANGGDRSHGRGCAQLSTQQLDCLSNPEPSSAPDDSNPVLCTVGASVSSSPTASKLSPPPLPSYSLPVTNDTCRPDDVLAGDTDETTAVAAPARKRKKKKNKKKSAAAGAAEGEDSSMSTAAAAPSAAGGTGTLIGGSTTVNNAVPVTGSLPPPPIPMIPGGGANSSSVVPGAFLGLDYSQGHGSSGGGSLLYSNLPHQHFHPQHRSGARGQFMMMANGTQGSSIGGDGAGDRLMMNYSMNGGAGCIEGVGGDYTNAATAACAAGEGGTYGRGGSAAMMMPMMAPNYHPHHHHSRHESSGSGGVYGYHHGVMSDCNRGLPVGMSPAHAQMSHQGMGRGMQEEQRSQQHAQQQQQQQPQTPYLYPPQPILMNGGGNAGNASYPANTGYIRNGSAHRGGGGGGPQYSLQSPQQHQQYYYQNLRHNSQPYFHGGNSSTNGADASAMQRGLIMATGEGNSGAESGGRGDCAGGLLPYSGEDVGSRVQSQGPVEDMVSAPHQPQGNVTFRPPMPAVNASGITYYPSNSAAPTTGAAAAVVTNNGSVNSSYASVGSRGGVSGAMMPRDGGTAVSAEARLPREEVIAADIAADAAPRSVFQFTPEVSPRLCRLIERELLTYLTPSLACLQRRRSQLETLAGYITAALRHAGRQTGHDYGDISYYIFGSVNMRTVLPDGDNDVTVEVDGLVAREATLTPPPSPRKPLSSSSLSDGGGAATDASAKAAVLPVTTDSSTGSVEGTMQLTTTTDGCPRLVAPAVLSISSGEVLSRVRDYLRSFKTPVFVDSLVMAEVRVLKLAMEGCNYDITIGQFGGVNCVRFLHEMDAVIGDHHVLKRTLLLLKAWCCYEAHILGGQAGYIGSYAATVMLISMLNTVEFLEDIDSAQTDSDSNGDGTAAEAEKAAVKLDSLMSGDSAAEEEECLSQNPEFLSSVPVTTATKASTTKGAKKNQEGEGLLSDTTSPTSSNRGGCCQDREAAGQSGMSPSRPVGGDTTTANAASPRPLSPLTLFARFLKFYAYFDFDRYCVTAFGPLPLHKITSTPLDLSYLEVDAAHNKPLEGVAASNRASTDLSFLGLTPEGEAAIGHLVRRRQQPLLTVSGVKHLLDEMNRSRHAERQARYEARQHQKDSDTSRNTAVLRSVSTSSAVQLNRAGCAAEDTGLMCPSCNTAVFPVRDMNVLDPLRWGSNMVRGVCRNHLQRIQRAFLEGLRLLDVASQQIGGDVMQMGVTGGAASANASRTSGGAGGAGTTGRRRAGVGVVKGAASPTSQWSVFSAASSSNRSWTDSAANGATSPARPQQGAINGVSIYGSPGSAVEAGSGGGGEVQLCPGYPSPHSQCTLREVGALQMLFPRTIDAIRKHSHLNCPWSHEGTDAAALGGVPQCPNCTKPSLLCTPAIRSMCHPQLIFHPSKASEGSSTAVTGGRQSKQLPLTSSKATSSPTTASPQKSPSLAVSPTHSKQQGPGGRRSNVAAAEQVASELEEAFAGQDTSEEARNGGPLGESMVPVTEKPLARDCAPSRASGSQPPPPSSSTASVPLLQGNGYISGAVEGMMHPHAHQIYSSGGAGNSGGVGCAYVSAYPAMSLSPSIAEEKYYAMHACAAAGGNAGGAGSSSGYSLSPSHHGNRNMGPTSQQHQHHHYTQQQQHGQQAHALVGSMPSPATQGTYNMSNGGATGNSGQRAYATNQTATVSMEGHEYLSHGGQPYVPGLRPQPQQYPYPHQQHHRPRGDEGNMPQSNGNNGQKGGGGSHPMNHNNSSSDFNGQAPLLQRL